MSSEFGCAKKFFFSYIFVKFNLWPSVIEYPTEEAAEAAAAPAASVKTENI